MRQQVRIVYEDDNELEINFNCDEDPKSRNRLTFRLHPPGPAIHTESPCDEAEKADESFETLPSVSDEPDEFVIRVWKYKGYLIVQYGENIFSIYNQTGEHLKEFTTPDDAREKVDKLVKKSGLHP